MQKENGLRMVLLVLVFVLFSMLSSPVIAGSECHNGVSVATEPGGYVTPSQMQVCGWTVIDLPMHFSTSPGQNITISFRGGAGPFNWEISGDGSGFSFAGGVLTATTDERSISVEVSAGSCGACMITVTDELCQESSFCTVASSRYYSDDDWYQVPYDGTPFSERFHYHRTYYDLEGNVTSSAWWSCCGSGGGLPIDVDYGCNNVEGYTMCSAPYCQDGPTCGNTGRWCYGSFGVCY
jgi:hypothetical protein